MKIFLTALTVAIVVYGVVILIASIQGPPDD